MEDSDYSIMFINRWKELRQGVFRTDSIMQFIDNSVLYLGESVDHNYERWPILGTYVWPNYFIGSTYSEEIDYLKGWVSDRLHWIDNNIDRQKVEPVPVGSKNILVYPNPVKDEMTFVFSTASISRISVEIYDLTGRRVFNTLYFPEEAGYQQFNYTITGLSPVSYILKLKQGTRIIGNTQIIIL
jgi:hypothetical protein